MAISRFIDGSTVSQLIDDGFDITECEVCGATIALRRSGDNQNITVCNHIVCIEAGIKEAARRMKNAQE